jgi:hypothetical protein
LISHELSLERLIGTHDSDWVAQAHVRYSTTTARFIKTFSILPIFQVRNIFDTVVSKMDHIATMSRISPIAYVPKEYMAWDEKRRAEFVVERSSW